MAIAQDSTETGLMSRRSALSSAKPPSVKTSSSMCPANMLANRRAASVNGRTMKVEKNSIGISSGRMNQGAGGIREFLMYLHEAVLPDAEVDEHHVADHREERREGDVRVRRDLDTAG